MNGRRALVGLCMLCALLVSAFAAQSASAVGTTAYTCVKGGTGGTGVKYTTPHCRPKDESGEYGHTAIANGTTTELTVNGKDEKGNSITGFLVSTAFGATIELEGKSVTGTGQMTNSIEGGEMIASGVGAITYTNVSVVKPLNCKVKTDGPANEELEDGVIHTEALKTTTKEQGDRLKFEPVTAPTVARFWLVTDKGPPASPCPLHTNTFTVTGSVTGVPNGATTEFTEADTTAQNTLKLNGAKAGLSGSYTIEGRANPGDPYKPLSVTT
jgi:hypothetical protein